MWKVFSDQTDLEITYKYVITYSLSHLDCHCPAVITYQNYNAEANHSIEMGLRAETCKETRKETATKIHRQQTDQDLTLLKKELITIAANIPTALGGGNHGHAGITVEQAKYLVMMGGTAFINPIHPGIHPTSLAANVAAGTRAMAGAVHKEQISQFKIFAGVEHAIKEITLKAVEHDYLLEIEDKTLGFLNQTPRQMIDHLRSRGKARDFADTKTLLAERDAEWDVSKVPQIYFN
jgi:hypothetical protein